MITMNDGSIVCHSCTRTYKIADDEVLTWHQDGSVTVTVEKKDKVLVHQPMVSKVGNTTYLCLPAYKQVSETTKTPKTAADKVEEVQGWLTLALCVLSIICIVLFFIAFCSVKRMRNIPGSTIAGNMLMFLLAYITFLVKDLVKVEGYIPHGMACKVIGVLINYFFLAGFIFMIIYAVLIIRSLEFVDLDSRYTSAYIIQVWVAGVLTPFIFIIPAVLMDKFNSDSVWSPGYGDDHACFMENRQGALLFFVAPIGLCLLLSTVIYAIVVHRLRQIAAATSRVRQSHKEKVFLCLKLIIVLGFNWISALPLTAVDRKEHATAYAVLSTIFIMLCCLHGVFGFLIFVVSGSNLKLIKATYDRFSSSQSTSSGGKATRTLSGPGIKSSSTGASEMSTMTRGFDNKASCKYSPIISEKFSHDGDNNIHHTSQYNDAMTDEPRVETLSPSGVTSQIGVSNGVNNVSPVSTRSNNSQRKCDFF